MRRPVRNRRVAWNGLSLWDPMAIISTNKLVPLQEDDLLGIIPLDQIGEAAVKAVGECFSQGGKLLDDGTAVGSSPAHTRRETIRWLIDLPAGSQGPAQRPFWVSAAPTSKAISSFKVASKLAVT
jgi:hypothetical protein